ncbi:uncharacterized protein LOC110020102 [Phalaenopsis equestris]|uniref:uncharacterized protein LOC110020102 n=1 Tax=Phalaenopsis equestris TaxID=78828 RepID=UPI0009E43C75|nr:uncharacterized protein LOC110020102 [Phalaenopsis equestris]XP_020573744.1 uncharacterized protein LOC110020102 [Phalaenopsis equestris]
MHRSRFQTPGWAAFDRKHREKQGSGTEGAVVPYPIISNETNSDLMESSNNTNSGESSVSIGPVPTRSFSSVVLSSKPIEFPFFNTHSKPGTLNINIDGDEHDAVRESNVNPIWMLKDVHSWADQQLIKDILAAVNNDVGKASILLKEMFSSETETKNVQPGSFGMCSQINLSEHVDVFLERSSTFEENKLSNNSHNKLMVKQFYVPNEPDWEEDDVYLSCRKDALKMMRAASQHSRGASNAYLRGDHLTAQQLSARAREEWTTAEQLNSQAAEEILRIRNSNNDLWKLDLHGLHATEAVHALKQHLQRIESMMMNHSVSPHEFAKVETIQASPSFVSLSGLETSSNAKGIIVPQQRQTLLHVITGTGNHSKGQASLPAAIKSFLIDGGYRFDDARAGVISVRPIFRHR